MNEHELRDAEQRRAQSTADQLHRRFAEKKEEIGPTESSDVWRDSMLWREAMLCVMRNREVRSVAQVDECTGIAERYINLFKARFK